MELYFESRERIISVDVEIKQNNINPVFQSLLWFPSQKGYQAILMSVLVIIFYKLFCLCSSMIHAAWTMRWNCINHAWIMHWGKFCFSIQSEKIIIVKRISPSKNSTKNEFAFWVVKNFDLNHVKEKFVSLPSLSISFKNWSLKTLNS